MKWIKLIRPPVKAGSLCLFLTLLFLFTSASFCDKYDGVCKQDPDEDGICTEESVVPPGKDNCPDIANADQLDQDNDHIGDVCDPCPVNPSPTCGHSYPGDFAIIYTDEEFPNDPFCYPMTIEQVNPSMLEITIDYTSEGFPQIESGTTSPNPDGTFYAETRSDPLIEIVITGTNLQNNVTTFDEFSGRASLLQGTFEFLYIFEGETTITTRGTYEALLDEPCP